MRPDALFPGCSLSNDRRVLTLARGRSSPLPGMGPRGANPTRTAGDYVAITSIFAYASAYCFGTFALSGLARLLEITC